METLALNAVVFHDNTSASDDFAGVTFLVDLAQTSPGTEDLGVSDLDQVDFVLSAQGLNELDILRLGASLDKHAEVGLALVQGLGALAETTSKTVMDEGVLQDLLQKHSVRVRGLPFPYTHLKCFFDRHLALGSVSGNLDLSRGINLDFISSVRHPVR